MRWYFCVYLQEASFFVGWISRLRCLKLHNCYFFWPGRCLCSSEQKRSQRSHREARQVWGHLNFMMVQKSNKVFTPHLHAGLWVHSCPSVGLRTQPGWPCPRSPLDHRCGTCGRFPLCVFHILKFWYLSWNTNWQGGNKSSGGSQLFSNKVIKPLS